MAGTWLGSKHYEGNAFDLRTWIYTEGEVSVFVGEGSVRWVWITMLSTRLITFTLSSIQISNYISGKNLGLSDTVCPFFIFF